MLSDPERRAEYDGAAEYAIGDFGVENIYCVFEPSCSRVKGCPWARRRARRRTSRYKKKLRSFLDFTSGVVGLGGTRVARWRRWQRVASACTTFPSASKRVGKTFAPTRRTP